MPNLTVSTAVDDLLAAASNAAFRTQLGSTATGDALFTAVSASAGRTTLGATATGASVFTAADASEARIALGLGTTDSPTFGNAAFSTGSIATTQPLTLTQTWTASGTIYTGFRVNIADTASNAASLLMDLQRDGVSRFSVDKFGLIALPVTGGDGSGFVAGGSNLTNCRAYIGQYGMRLRENLGLQWSASTNLNLTDLSLLRDAANTLAQRNGTNAQTSRIYDTYASATDYHRLAIATARATATGMSGATITLTNIIPAGAVVVGVTCKVTTAITGATSFQLGTAADPDRFGATIAIASGTTSDNQNWTSGTIECFPAATSLVLTANGSNFAAGAVYVSVQYLSGQAD
jgi:hypothetical protein